MPNTVHYDGGSMFHTIASKRRRRNWFLRVTKTRPYTVLVNKLPPQKAWPKGCGACMSFPKSDEWVLFFNRESSRDKYCIGGNAQFISLEDVAVMIEQSGVA